MTKTALVSPHEARGNYRSYIIGFLASLALTLTAYGLVEGHAISGKWALALAIGGLALIQFVIQITLFLHLGREAKPRLRLLVFGFMLSVVVILVAGSIWIMYNLNYRMMSPSQITNYMNAQDGGL